MTELFLTYEVVLPTGEKHSTELFRVGGNSYQRNSENINGIPSFIILQHTLAFKLRPIFASAIIYSCRRSWEFCLKVNTRVLQLKKIPRRQKHSNHSSICLANLQLFLTNETHGNIDFVWDERLEILSYKWAALKDATAWLSTLGGGHSSLGDHFSNHAEIAGQLSKKQFLLALSLGDKGLEYRCRLYYSISLMQRGHIKKAKKLIVFIYKEARNKLLDEKLEKMCIGTWNKLKYERTRR